MNFDIVSFGSAVIDAFVNTDVSNKNNFLNYPVGEKMLVNNLHFDIGGGGTNTAVAFSRLGLKTGCISALGDDNNGKIILKLLKKEKINFLGPIKKRKLSGYSVILDSKDKDRTILTYKGVNNEIYFSEIKKFNAKWIYYSSLLEKSFQTQKKLANLLVRKGTKLAFNPSSYHIENEDLTKILKSTSILILNKEEAESLAKKHKKTKDCLYSLSELGPEIIVITDKNNPVRCLYNQKEYNITPHKNIKVVERTGAGDAFASGFVAGIVAKKDINYCLRLGIEESEAVIGHFGAKNNLIKKSLKK
jgi:ribokinase